MNKIILLSVAATFAVAGNAATDSPSEVKSTEITKTLGSKFLELDVNFFGKIVPRTLSLSEVSTITSLVPLDFRVGEKLETTTESALSSAKFGQLVDGTFDGSLSFKSKKTGLVFEDLTSVVVGASVFKVEVPTQELFSFKAAHKASSKSKFLWHDKGEWSVWLKDSTGKLAGSVHGKSTFLQKGTASEDKSALVAAAEIPGTQDLPGGGKDIQGVKIDPVKEEVFVAFTVDRIVPNDQFLEDLGINGELTKKFVSSVDLTAKLS